MTQAPLEFAAAIPAVADRTGFDIGWDHVRLGLAPDPELLRHDTPVAQGWSAGRTVFGPRAAPAGHAVRHWLALRVRAWSEGSPFDEQVLTAQHIAALDALRCPVLRQPLGGTASQPTAASIERLNPAAPYAPGNLVVLCRAVARAAADADLNEALRRARAAAEGPIAGLDAAAWWRVATLRSFATPLPFAEATRLPLAVLPRDAGAVVNAVQRLQAQLTLWFTAPGWSLRCRQLAARFTDDAMRHDFNLFVASLMPHVVGSGSEPHALRSALEDAGLHDRVHRRWRHFAWSLGETGVEALLAELATARAVPPWPAATVRRRTPPRARSGGAPGR